MPKEGKNEKFERLLCEALAPHLDDGFQLTGGPHHGFKCVTSFGHQTVMVDLSGASAPERILQFELGVWYEEFEAARRKLKLEPTPPGVAHFSNLTGNLQGYWPKLRRYDGEWIINLNDAPSASVPEFRPFLTSVMPLFFEACKSLRGIRKLLLKGYESPFLTFDPWQEIVLIDAALADWKHLTSFIRDSKSPLSQDKDPKLLKKVRDTFDFPG